jgi:hypothetical protein
MKGGAMDFRKHAFILAVVDSLHRHGSWTGKTHVQKSLSLLRDKGDVEVPFSFVPDRHGPYSFEVASALEEMRSYAAIEIEPVRTYGVVLCSGPMAKFVIERGQLTDTELDGIERVCNFVNGRNVWELERLATISWIRRREHVNSSLRALERLATLKPHIPRSEAERADADVLAWLAGRN